MIMDDCVFCKIANKEIPSHIVYEDEHLMAFLDLTQVTKGHTLLIPKKHIPDIFAYDDEDAQEIFKVLPRLARALDKAFPDMKGLNILNNNREAAYQSVFHTHIHLIPRYSRDDDDFKLHFPENVSEPDHEKMAQVKEQIAQAIKETK